MYGSKNGRLFYHIGKMYVYPSLHASHRQSQIVFHQNMDQLPALDHTQTGDIFEFELNAGDMLY